MSETVPPVFFKAANLAIGSLTLLSSLSQLSYLIYDFNAFLLALYAIPLSVLIILLEFQTVPVLYRYCSFYFSFIGRGFLYILLSLLVNFGGVFKVLITVFTFFLGLIYVAFEFLPQIEEPPNFRAEGAPLSVNDDDDEII
ncbi:hypothetical protein ZYGR_0H03460 [Zygosaccharomyces rouxii]|uniref:Golgi apparatus membrane protein TVP15 n=1 Tax=Zygosaccharomyces rouxii TaxID=4956 RepID=A0A1Q2ZVF8_ZYGRO|nr:hypothetical protein ZYGR_0H03460 [Zygosaccharomyces rouxii]